jgi:hypothetical protein
MFFKNTAISLLIWSCFLKTVLFQRAGGRIYLKDDQKRRAKVITGPEMTSGTCFCPAPKPEMAKEALEMAPPAGNDLFFVPLRLAISRSTG